MPHVNAFAMMSHLILQTYWAPISKQNTAVEANRPWVKKGCKKQCSENKKCCHFGVRAVKTWEDAQVYEQDDEMAKEVHMAWQVNGPEKAKDFKPVTWCAYGKCDAGGKTLELKTEGLKTKLNIDWFKKSGSAAETTVVPIEKVSGEDGSSFYVLVILFKHGFKIFDKTGKEVFKKLVTDGNMLQNLKEVKDQGDAAMWLKAWVCGLFEKGAPMAKINLHADEEGSVSSKQCVDPVESVGDEAAAQELVKAKLDAAGKTWSVAPARAGNSRGIAFASIACAVFASVSLTYVVLVKNSRLQVSVEE